jgi:hypothetical protein
LNRFVEAWPTPPEPIRRAVLALIGTALPEERDMPKKLAE